MRLHFLLIVLVACVLWALPARAQEVQGGLQPVTPATPVTFDPKAVTTTESAAMDRLQAAYPGILTYRDGSQLTRVYGRTFEMGDTPTESAARFVEANADLFGARAADLLPMTRILPAGNTTPLMYDAETGSYRFTLVYHSQYRDGIPVFRSDVRMLVKNEIGYPLIWAGSTLKRLGDFAPNTALRSTVDPTAVAPGMVNFTAVEPVIWAGLDDKLVAPVQAMTFVADNYGSGQDREKWLYVVDAATGEVLYKENQIVYTDVSGSVRGMATTLPKSAECNPETSTVMPYATVSLGSQTVYADASGNFTIPNSGTTSVSPTSYMGGHYFNVNDVTSSLETLSLAVTPPGPANFVHNSANTSASIRAQVNAYVQANKIRDWVLTQNPSYPTVSTQTGFGLNVNYNLTCNAYYDGSSLNFYLAGGGCANTAYSSVVHHEYGHHLCQVAGNGQDQYGEGVGDSVAVCIADDPILGYGFTGSCSSGLRSASNSMQYPCSDSDGGHTCAQLLSGCVWSTRNALQATNPSTYLSILSNLMVNSILMHGGSLVTPAIYSDWITLDGGASGLHAVEITTGFAAHNMVIAPANDLCANATYITSGTYGGITTNALNDGSSSCGSSTTSKDVWYKYTTGVAGTLNLDTCSSSYNTVLSVHTGCPGTSSNQVASGCNDNSTLCGTSSTQSSLSLAVTESTTYYIRVAGSSGATGSFTLHVSGPDPDIIAPTPNPMTFQASPDGTPKPISTTQATMTASEATDVSTPVEYYFSVSGVGGHASGWQTSRTYTDTNLQVNRFYAYKVKARDSKHNETADSPAVSLATFIETPTALSFGTITDNTIPVTAPGTFTRLTSNLSGMFFEVTKLDGTPVGGTQANAWVQVQSITAAGLTAGTTYRFRVKARNYYGANETPWYPTSGYIEQTTTGGTVACSLLGDMNGDGAVNGLDVEGFVRAKLGAAPISGENQGCANYGGTLDQDIAAFVADLLGV